MLPKISTSITDLQKQTVTQLKAALTAGMTKRDLLIKANGSDKISNEPIITYHTNGQIASQVETFLDVETNTVVSTNTITWTYYKSGEVDEITIEENGKRKTIKHFTDGRQPEVL